MKLKINENFDISLNLVHHFNDVIKKELLERLGDHEEVYNYLLKKYNSLLKDLYSNPRYYKESAFVKDESIEEKIFSLICYIFHSDSFIIYSTIIEIAKKTKKNYLSLFVVLNDKMNYKNDAYNSLLLFSKEDRGFIYDLLVEANKEGFLKKSLRVTDLLLKKEKDINELVEKKNKEVEDFLAKFKEEEDFIIFEEEDEWLNYFDIYSRMNKTNVKKILVSNEFKKYIEDTEEDLSIDEVGDLIEEYIKEEMNIKEYICNKILKEKPENVFLSKDDIINLTIDVKNLL